MIPISLAIAETKQVVSFRALATTISFFGSSGQGAALSTAGCTKLAFFLLPS